MVLGHRGGSISVVEYLSAVEKDDTKRSGLDIDLQFLESRLYWVGKS